ncbi:hypothetical protein QO227_10730 [Vibrio vulnificus]|nr:MULTISPECIES: hypothetical protein [Vibrio]MCG6463812.1 hypothetical protein [Vibrio parahaemolyticus]MCG6487587.1 hypothetical protein [Vibrio parahaemolyticus]MDK2602999.1 hypothetical protein [Vibrio vulnificus]MDK2719528.1 hypothetical protein [Vibrio vulnificus]
MTELERKALVLRRERLKKQDKQRANVQDKAKQFSTEWRNSIAVRAVSA